MVIIDDSFRGEIRRELIEEGTRCPNNNLIHNNNYYSTQQ